jgi:ribonucleotide monophosphatase NagD (HAD superfamily)
VVGDRLETDIDGAAAVGWDAALVLTGISTRAEAESAAHPPTYVLEDLSGLLA